MDSEDSIPVGGLGKMSGDAPIAHYLHDYSTTQKATVYLKSSLSFSERKLTCSNTKNARFRQVPLNAMFFICFSMFLL
jgi:hypothetical protein